MIKNASVVDYRPLNKAVKDYKPKTETVVNPGPKNNTVNTSFTDQLYDSTINVGEPMGLLLSLTYPNTFTFQTSFHP